MSLLQIKLYVIVMPHDKNYWMVDRVFRYNWSYSIETNQNEIISNRINYENILKLCVWSFSFLTKPFQYLIWLKYNAIKYTDRLLILLFKTSIHHSNGCNNRNYYFNVFNLNVEFKKNKFYASIRIDNITESLNIYDSIHINYIW